MNIESLFFLIRNHYLYSSSLKNETDFLTLIKMLFLTMLLGNFPIENE